METDKKVSTAAAIRKHREENPKATPKEIALAVGAKIRYVQSRLYIDEHKKAAPKRRGRKPKILTTTPHPLTKEVKHPLHSIFLQVIEQVMHGKGTRHGGATVPFVEQPWAHYAKLHGRGFLTGQAAKKLEEAASLRTGDAFEAEIFGAMAYLGMAVLKDRGDK